MLCSHVAVPQNLFFRKTVEKRSGVTVATGGGVDPTMNPRLYDMHFAFLTQARFSGVLFILHARASLVQNYVPLGWVRGALYKNLAQRAPVRSNRLYTALL